jgi:lysophospholipase L1-like esterase
MSRVILLLLSSAIALSLAELSVRVFDLGPEIAPVYEENFRLSDDPVLRYELAPESPDPPHRMNTFGMRGPEVLRAKPPGVFRIAVLGDSIAYGFGVEREESLPAVLEGILQRRYTAPGRRFEVLNFGVTGYGIAEVAQVLRVRALAFEPDVVVYAYCLNDPQEYSLELENLLARVTGAERGYLERVASANLRIFVLARYALESVTRAGRAYGAAHLWHRDDPQFVAVESGGYAGYYRALHRAPEGRRRALAGLDALAAISAETGVPVAVAVFPVFVDLEHYALTSVHDDVVAWSRERSLDAIDLLPVFAPLSAERIERMVIDPLHPSATGHVWGALAVLHELLAAGRLPGFDARDFAERLAEEPPPIRRFAPRLAAILAR